MKKQFDHTNYFEDTFNKNWIWKGFIRKSEICYRNRFWSQQRQQDFIKTTLKINDREIKDWKFNYKSHNRNYQSASFYWHNLKTKQIIRISDHWSETNGFYVIMQQTPAITNEVDQIRSVWWNLKFLPLKDQQLNNQFHDALWQTWNSSDKIYHLALTNFKDFKAIDQSDEIKKHLNKPYQIKPKHIPFKDCEPAIQQQRIQRRLTNRRNQYFKNVTKVRLEPLINQLVKTYFERKSNVDHWQNLLNQVKREPSFVKSSSGQAFANQFDCKNRLREVIKQRHPDLIFVTKKLIQPVWRKFWKALDEIKTTSP